VKRNSGSLPLELRPVAASIFHRSPYSVGAMRWVIVLLLVSL
jgi:hypothetical protein